MVSLPKINPCAVRYVSGLLCEITGTILQAASRRKCGCLANKSHTAFNRRENMIN